ncbi:MAG: type II toxin-antitoxin system Phd/YefM family antitoxin [Halothece sp. Uz-M2-17]|nr:type II toxin-antitoxin system Phd/YefM family antitoxin [Halothece sp. Uz-M2-17]
MDAINIHQAKTNLSQLLSRVKLGEEIIISNRGVPIAKLVPFNHVDRQSSLGQDQGQVTISEDFNDPLPEAILAEFEGSVE